MEITFDTELLMEDIKDVNHLRVVISRMLDAGEQHRLTRTNDDTSKMQKYARKMLFTVLEKKHKTLRLTEEEKRDGGRLVKDRIFDFPR